jgi:hypothetical protein
VKRLGYLLVVVCTLGLVCFFHDRDVYEENTQEVVRRLRDLGVK